MPHPAAGRPPAGRPPAVLVRPATPADADAVTRVAAATFPDACPPTTTQAAIEEHIRTNLSRDVIAGWIDRDEFAVVVAEDDAGRLLGYCMAELAPSPEPAVEAVVGPTAPVGCLSKLYVVAEARGAGAADALMAAGLDAMRGRGLTHAWLGTHTGNARANAFYERIGFRVVGERTFLVGGNPETDVTRLLSL